MTALARFAAGLLAVLVLGLAPVAAQAQVIGGLPAPVLLGKKDAYSDALVALDFVGRRTGGVPFCKAKGVITSNCASLPGLTVTRASGGYAETRDGRLVWFPANTLRLTNKGLLREEARTNKLTRANLNPTAADLPGFTLSGADAGLASITVVDDSAALAAIGLTGTAYKFDNSASPTNTFLTLGGSAIASGITTQVSAYIRGGAGQLRNTSLSGEGVTAFAASPSYVRQNVSILAAATRTPAIVATPGAVIYFILQQVEEGAFVTSPIPVAGASATRAADLITVSGVPVTAPASIQVDFAPPVLVTGSTVVVSQLDDGTNSNRLYLVHSGSGLGRAAVQAGGVSQADVQAGSLLAGTSRLAGRFATDDVNAGLKGGSGTADTTATMPTGLNTLRLAGSATGGSMDNSTLERVVIFASPANDNTLAAKTAVGAW